MLAMERQDKILQIIQEKGVVQVEELAKEFEVSEMTIRRDFAKLHLNNQIERCHGGAISKNEIHYHEKKICNKSVKQELAEICKCYISKGDTVYLDAGTTTYEIAKKIHNIEQITVVTNDIEIAHVLMPTKVQVIVCGGVLQKETGSVIGYYATQMIQDFQFDIAFFGASYIDEHFQVMTPTLEKVFLKREVLKRSNLSYLVVDADKFNKKSVQVINHLQDYTGVITNRVFCMHELTEKEKATINFIV